MLPKSFIDFRVLGSENAEPYAVLARMYSVLHGAFGNSDGKYAVAFPEAKHGAVRRSTGHMIRVFASSAMDLYILLEKVRGHHVMRDYAQVGMPRDVPADFNGPWMTWQRVRVQKKEGVNREKTIQRAIESPYIEIRSNGTGCLFALRFKTVKAAPQTAEFFPNSYGLAVGGNRSGHGANMFSLPVID